MSQNGLLLVVGDFNASHSELENIEWCGVMGNHGVDNVYKAGRTLFTFVQ